MADALSELARIASLKREKPPGEWESLSPNERRGPSKVLKLSKAGGLPAELVVTTEKGAGNPTSNSGLPLGKVFGEPYLDE